jgi:hypothetical protein
VSIAKSCIGGENHPGTVGDRLGDHGWEGVEARDSTRKRFEKGEGYLVWKYVFVD